MVIDSMKTKRQGRRWAGRISFVLVLFLLLPSSGCAQSTGSPLDRARAALNHGEYDEARTLFGQAVDESPVDDAVLGLAASYEAVGAYDEGLVAINQLLQAGAPTPAAYLAQGRLLEKVGRLDDASRAYLQALRLRADYWLARVDLGFLLMKMGRSREAYEILADVYLTWEQGLLRTVPELTAAGRAAATLDRYRDANEAFRTAHTLDATDVANLYEWAELFRTRFNEADARRTYEEALTVNPNHAPSLVGLASSGFNFERQEELAQQALAVNPNFAPALDLLAGLEILDGRYKEAEALARRAINVNPASVTSLSQLASSQYLRGDSTAYLETERLARSLTPETSSFYLGLAENATYRFRYPDAVVFAEQAVRANGRDANAHAEYGTALLRIGRRAAARRHLEAAFEFDPYNLFASNTLTLLDELENFTLHESRHFRLLIHADEADVLGPLMLQTAEEAYEALHERYGYSPRDKILIEAYNDADDFAVRIAGVPHRGLLGVCFGDVLAVNTPVAQGSSPYNWARTLWHEIAHTMAIGVSQHHVPRWFTEGLAVYEEAVARPEWGREMQLAFLAAHEQDRLLPLERIDQGFTRPEFPGQVLLSYYHASRVIDLIVRQNDFSSITDILNRLAEGTSIGDAIVQATGNDVSTLDARLRDELSAERRRRAQALSGLPDLLADEDVELNAATTGSAEAPFFRQIRRGAQALERGDLDRAEAAYRNAISIYPEYVGDESPYLGLARVYREQNRPDSVMSVLARYLDIAEDDVQISLELASLYEERGDVGQAAALRERSLFVAPYDPLVRTSLADAYDELGEHERAVAHRRAVVALNPPDRAGAQFHLARSLFAAGRPAEARRAVLQSLEAAPGFREAQELLLEIVE